MNIEMIKLAIHLDCGLVSPNPNGTITILPPDLNYLRGIALTPEEYRVYINAIVLTMEEKLQRLETQIEEIEKGESV